VPFLPSRLFLTISALSLDTLTSSTIGTSWHRVSTVNASLPIANHYATLDALTNEEWPALEMVSAIQYGSSFMSGLGHILNASWAVSCETGDCTFPRYQSIGVKFDCITENVSLLDNQYILDNYGGVLSVPVNTGSTSITVNSTTGNTKQWPFDMVGPPIARTGIIINQSGWKQPLGMQCILNWGTQDLNATVSANSAFRLAEEILNTNSTDEDKTYDNTQGYRWRSSECWVNGIPQTAKQPNGSWVQDQCNYFVGPETHQGLENYFIDPTYGFSGIFLNKDNAITHATPFLQNLYETIQPDQNVTQANIIQLWKNVADAITRVTRIIDPTAHTTTLGTM
jgi:hypothetical protein